MERIFLKSLSRMFWHSKENSQLLPWKCSSSNTVIRNFPLCSNCSCGFMAAVDHHAFLNTRGDNHYQSHISKLQGGLSENPFLDKVFVAWLFLINMIISSLCLCSLSLHRSPMFHFEGWNTHVLRWDRSSIINVVAKPLSSVFIAQRSSFSGECASGLLTQQQPTEKPH